jgi:hypothetical protein
MKRKKINTKSLNEDTKMHEEIKNRFYSSCSFVPS